MAKKINKELAIELIKQSHNYYSAFCIMPIIGKKDGTVIWTGGEFYFLEKEEFYISIRDIYWRNNQPMAIYEIAMHSKCPIGLEVAKSMKNETDQLKVNKEKEDDLPVLYNNGEKSYIFLKAKK